MKKSAASHAKTAVFVVLMLLFLVQDRVQDELAVIQYLDELVALVIIPVVGCRFVQGRFRSRPSRRQTTFFLLLAVFWISGWVGFILHHYQPLSNTVKDSYVNLKFFMALGASWLFFDDGKTDPKKVERSLWHVLNVITCVLFILCLVNLFVDIFPKETRYGYPAIKLFYTSYTALVAQCVFLCAIYFRLYEYFRNRVLIPVGMLFVVMFFTQRIKALGAMACIVFIYLILFSKRKKLGLVLACGCGGVAVFAAVCQLFYYYVTLRAEAARAILTIVAPYIAKDYFPFGTGWGTYGSAFSVEPYSPVYEMYQISGVWGISPSYHDFVSDTFWPMLLGQCGVIGTLAYVGVVVMLVKKVVALRKQNICTFASGLIPILYLLIASTSESAFVNPTAVPFALWFGMLFAERHQEASLDGQERSV